MLVWLLDLDVGGATLHLSTRPTTWDGTQYEGGLDSVRLEEGIAQLGDMPDVRQAEVRVAPYVDLALLASYAHDLSRARAVLRLWRDDEPEYRATIQLEQARVSAPEVGGANEAMALTLTAEPYEDTASIVAAGARVDETTWPNAAKGEIGRVYPLPIGTPGKFGDDVPATPALVVVWDTTQYAQKLLVSSEPVDSGEVRIWFSENQTGDFWTPGTVVHEADGSGRIVATVSVAGKSSAVRDAEQLWIGWDSPSPSLSSAGRAIYSSRRPRAALSVGDLLLEMVARTSIAVDEASWRQVAVDLIHPAGWYVAEDRSPMDALTEVVRSLPVALWSSPRGLAAVRLPTEVLRAHCIPLVEGVTAHRLGPMRMPQRPEEQVSSVRVSFAPDQARGGPRGWEIRGRDPALVRSDVYIRAARDIFTAPSTHTEDLDWTYDRTAAQRVAAWLARSRAVSPRLIRLHVAEDLARALIIGTAVKYTASDLHLDKEVGIVTGRVLTDLPMWEIEVSMLAGTVSSIQETGDGSYDEPPPPVDPPEQ